MRAHIQKMLEENLMLSWADLRKQMLPEEIVAFYESKDREELVDAGFRPAESLLPESDWIVRLKPAKKGPKIYPIKLVRTVGDQRTGGYYEVVMDNEQHIHVTAIYGCGKTPVWHFHDNSQHPVFRHHGETAIGLSFREDSE